MKDRLPFTHVVLFGLLFVRNYAGQNGGGASAIAPSSCTFAGNYSMGQGGGTCDNILADCTVTGNVAWNNLWDTGNGGGVSGERLYRSRIVGNHARSEGAPISATAAGVGSTWPPMSSTASSPTTRSTTAPAVSPARRSTTP